MNPWDQLIFFITGLFLLVYSFYWCVNVLGILYGLWKLHTNTIFLSLDPEDRPPVSILKPLVGVDPNLYSNLETFFNLDYPKFEVIFCVEEDIDPAVMVVKSLMNKYPSINARLFIGAERIGINPKVNNMLQGYNVVLYDFVLVSDSGLRMRPNTLSEMMSLMTQSVGIVHQLPFTCDRQGFIGALEKVTFGTHLAKFSLFCNLLGLNCMTGMSFVFRKHILDECGGLRAFGDTLAEDFYIAQAIISKGWLTCLSSYPAQQNVSCYSVSRHQQRLFRWAKLRSRLLMFANFELCIRSFFLGIMFAAVMVLIFNCSGLAIFCIHLLASFLSDFLLLRIVQNGPLPFSKFEYLVAWFFSELTAIHISLCTFFDSSITWRNKHYRLLAGTKAEEITPKLCV